MASGDDTGDRNEQGDESLDSPTNLNRPPRGASGRGHTVGFIDLEEVNYELMHPHGHRIYDRMYRTDGDVRQVVKLLTDPVIAGTWTVNPYGGEDADDEAIEHAKLVTWVLFEYMAPNLLGHLQQALPILVRSGFCPAEEAWGTTTYEGRMIVAPSTLAIRLPRTIHQFEQDDWGKLRRIKQYLPTPKRSLAGQEGSANNGPSDYKFDDGYVWLDAKNLVYYRLDAEGDNWEGVSFLRPAYKHWKLKDAIERIDAVAQEREAIGIPICYPPMGATDEQLDTMEQVLANMRTNEQSFIIAPGPKQGQGAPDGTGWLIEVIGYDRTGSGRDPQPSLQYHTNKIAAAFISEFMRLGHGETGARATAQVQQDPFLTSVEAFVHIVEDALNVLVKKIIDYNFPSVKNYPRLAMSLIDSTSLTQLADFVLKLTQVGALLPDAQLEDFLRARADLPPVNPESRKKRKKDDDQIRRDIVQGGGQNGDAFGANGKPGSPHGSKPVSAKTQTSGKGLDDDAPLRDTVTLSSYNEHFDRVYRRDLDQHEMGVDLAAMEDQFDAMPRSMSTVLQGHVMDMARGGKGDGLEKSILDMLNAGYVMGRQHVHRELGLDSGLLLDRGGNDRGKKSLKQRAKTSARYMRAAIDDAYQNADLVHGDENPAHRQLAAERAGQAAARQVGRVHGVGSILLGRNDMAHENRGHIVGVRYSAILDHGTCGHCEEADDGIIRGLEDPVRLDRRPPNRHCESLASGRNMCRCFEVYVRAPSTVS